MFCVFSKASVQLAIMVKWQYKHSNLARNDILSKSCFMDWKEPIKGHFQIQSNLKKICISLSNYLHGTGINKTVSDVANWKFSWALFWKCLKACAWAASYFSAPPGGVLKVFYPMCFLRLTLQKSAHNN